MDAEDLIFGIQNLDALDTLYCMLVSPLIKSGGLSKK